MNTVLASAPLTIHGRAGRPLVFPGRVLLAPMEGITDPLFRDLVIDLGGVGGACTEFIRISSSAMSVKVVARELGPRRHPCPVGVQFMAAEERFVTASVQAAERAGAPWIDLNFGCPVPVVFNKCAGSALLAKPELLARIIATAVAATGLPVSAKLRAGIDSPQHVAELVLAAAAAGAALITVHARLRCQSYAEPATWAWLAAAKAALARVPGAPPLVGNGGIEVAADVARLRAETGCDAAMVGRAALADPFIFRVAAGGAPADAAEAAAFVLRYDAAICRARGAHASLTKLKQLTRYYRAGGLFDADPQARQRLLRCPDLAALRAWYAAAGGLPVTRAGACGG